MIPVDFQMIDDAQKVIQPSLLWVKGGLQLHLIVANVMQHDYELLLFLSAHIQILQKLLKTCFSRRAPWGASHATKMN